MKRKYYICPDIVESSVQDVITMSGNEFIEDDFSNPFDDIDF